MHRNMQILEKHTENSQEAGGSKACSVRIHKVLGTISNKTKEDSQSPDLTEWTTTKEDRGMCLT